MLNIQFQASRLKGSEEEDFEYFSMYFYDLNLGPLVQDHLGTWDLHLNKFLVNNHQAMLHTKFQTSKPSGSEEEEF